MSEKEKLFLHGADWTFPLVSCSASASPVGHALQDFVADSVPVIGKPWPLGEKKEALCHECPCIIVSCFGDEIWNTLNLNAELDLQELSSKRESYIIQPLNNECNHFSSNLLVAASDSRGAMYGIYELSERLFGTDPLKHWSDFVPSFQSTVVWSDGRVESGEPFFRYRGFFINDEDALMAWKGEVEDGLVAPEVHRMIIETVCRLRGNMLAPPMWAGYMDEGSRRLLQERGLYYTASHLEVLLSNPQNYWHSWCEETYGESLPYSYSLHPDKLEAYWRETIQKHSKNQNIWPVGLRGNMDCALWESDPGAPEDIAGRAKLVSSALQKQLSLLKEEMPESQIVATLTMRDEVLDLYLSGYLEIPEGVVLVWDDLARRSIMRRLPDHNAEPLEKLQHGVYYHLNYCQNPRMQYLPPRILTSEFKRIINSGATEYALFNVGNIRELALLAKCAMQLVWNPAPYLNNTLGDQILLQNAVAASYPDGPHDVLIKLYLDFFEKEYSYRVSQVTDCVGPLVTSHELYEIWDNTSLLDLLKENKPKEDLIKYVKAIDFSSLPDRCWCFSPDAIEFSLKDWESLLIRAKAIQPLVSDASRPFFKSNLLIQIQTSRCFNRWAFEVLQGFNKIIDQHWADAAHHFTRAALALEELEECRLDVSQGKWLNWYRGEYHNVFSKSLWTLKPKWHTEDCHEISRQLSSLI